MAPNENPTNTPEINPNFFMPPNVIDLRYQDREGVENSDIGESELSSNDDYLDLPKGQEGALPIPQDLVIASQIVRSIPGGGYVVDIVVETPDIPGVQTFEVSVAKT